MKAGTTIAAAVLTAAAWAGAAAAQEVVLTYGAQANAIFSDGDEDFSGEGYIDASYAGLTFGIWAGSLNGAGPDQYEYELSLSYARDFGRLATALTYTAYFLDRTGYATQDLELALGTNLTEQLNVTAYAAYDLDFDFWDTSLEATYGFTDAVALRGLVGDDSVGVYTEVELTYNFYKGAWVGVLYEDADYLPGTTTLSVGYDW